MALIKLEELLSGSATLDWDSTVMTGTTTRVSDVIELGDNALDVSWQPAWAEGSSVLGDFGVDLSNDNVKFTPGVLDTDFAVIGPAINGNSDSQLVHGAMRAKYARLSYTNVSGTGTLTDGVHVNAKRSGQ